VWVRYHAFAYLSRRKSVGTQAEFYRIREELLRVILRRVPVWVNGHLELGFTRLASWKSSHERATAESAALVRASAAAVLRLLGEEELLRDGRSSAEAASFRARSALSLLAAADLLEREPDRAPDYITRLLAR